jgi:hypothetical protein
MGAHLCAQLVQRVTLRVGRQLGEVEGVLGAFPPRRCALLCGALQPLRHAGQLRACIPC